MSHFDIVDSATDRIDRRSIVGSIATVVGVTVFLFGIVYLNFWTELGATLHVFRAYSLATIILLSSVVVTRRFDLLSPTLLVVVGLLVFSSGFSHGGGGCVALAPQGDEYGASYDRYTDTISFGYPLEAGTDDYRCTVRLSPEQIRIGYFATTAGTLLLLRDLEKL